MSNFKRTFEVTVDDEGKTRAKDGKNMGNVEELRS